MPKLHDHLRGLADRKKIVDPKLNLDEYEVIPPQAVASANILTDFWIRLGRPNTPFTPAGEKLMKLIIATWEDGYPKEMREWYKDRQDYQKAEMGITEQVHQRTGRSLASYPMPIYNMMKKLFVGFDPTERKNCIKLVRKWPMFRMANKV